jgi:CDP-diacylglycerol--serine O-phosphatidyltransferase
LAVICVLQNGIIITTDSNGVQLIDVPEKIWMASLFIGMAAVVDFLDGFVARIFKAASEMGKQLDSLADLVSFGVAPGLIVYQFLRLSFSQEDGGIDTSIGWLLPSLLLPCAAAWRLARFNLDKEQSFSFKGLPVPAAGIFIASLPLIYWNVNQVWAIQVLINKWFLYAIIALISGLMISSIPLMSFKFKDFTVKNNWPRYLLAVLAIILFLIVQWLAIPVIIILYVILSLAFKTKTS